MGVTVGPFGCPFLMVGPSARFVCPFDCPLLYFATQKNETVGDRFFKFFEF